ncbi:MAG: hypothetical protein M2R45_03859 [Verrucomicrobia subdivision 3 bacterium]|nr:hypothetical protein [Limisphaerales bacterium]
MERLLDECEMALVLNQKVVFEILDVSRDG